jgi:type III secretory pathway component EscU
VFIYFWCAKVLFFFFVKMKMVKQVRESVRILIKQLNSPFSISLNFWDKQ